MDYEYVYEIWQGGMCIAKVVGNDRDQVINNASHYAMVYSKDGAVEIRDKSYAKDS